MKVAIPKSRRRIAPLFEVAERFLIVDLDRSPTGHARPWRIWRTGDLLIDEKCRALRAEGVEVLLCGALSKAWERYLIELGIEVHPFLLGNIDDILATFEQEGAAGMYRQTMPGRLRHRGVQGRANGERHCCGNLCIFSTYKES